MGRSPELAQGFRGAMRTPAARHPPSGWSLVTAETQGDVSPEDVTTTLRVRQRHSKELKGPGSPSSSTSRVPRSRAVIPLSAGPGLGVQASERRHCLHWQGSAVANSEEMTIHGRIKGLLIESKKSRKCRSISTLLTHWNYLGSFKNIDAWVLTPEIMN